MPWQDDTFRWVGHLPWFTDGGGRDNWQLVEVRQDTRRRTTVCTLIYEDPDGNKEWVEEPIYHHSQYWFVGSSQCLRDGRLEFWTIWEHKWWCKGEHAQDDGEISDMETT